MAASLAAVPAKSPKEYLDHSNQLPTGSAAEKARASRLPNHIRNCPARYICQVFNSTAKADMPSNGKLLILARKVAASAKPVKIPSRRAGGSPRSHFTRKI